MKIKEGYMLRQIMDEWLVIPVGKNAPDADSMLTLSESSAMLWKRLEEGAEERELVSLLLEKYEVDEKTAADDVTAFLDLLRQDGILID